MDKAYYGDRTIEADKYYYENINKLLNEVAELKVKVETLEERLYDVFWDMQEMKQ